MKLALTKEARKVRKEKIESTQRQKKILNSEIEGFCKRSRAINILKIYTPTLCSILKLKTMSKREYLRCRADILETN